MNKLTNIIEDSNKDVAKLRENRDETLSPLVANESADAEESGNETALDEDNSEENTSEYADVNFNDLTEYFSYKDVIPRQEKEANRVAYSKSSDNLYQLRPRSVVEVRNIPSEGVKVWESLDRAGYISTGKPCCHSPCPLHYERNCSSEQDIRILQLENRTPSKGDLRLNLPNTSNIPQTLSLLQAKSDLRIRSRQLQVFWGIDSYPERYSDTETSDPFLNSNYLCCDKRKSSVDLHKKRVRFSVSKMEGDLNFRVTLSIKNEADGQTVFYKVDKNRFRKEKTIKLMVESMYRIDISFKPTQTLARALVRGHEVQTIERVHDSTASAYSLHLSTCNLQPSPKGHRDEITFLIQLTNGLVLQTFLQVKFYKAGDTQHCEWGSTFHCVEYECESYPESGVIAILKETFR